MANVIQLGLRAAEVSNAVLFCAIAPPNIAIVPLRTPSDVPRRQHD